MRTRSFNLNLRRPSLPDIAALVGCLFFLATVGCGYFFAMDVKRAQRAEDLDRAARSLLIAMLDAETGQRGYILTGSEDYLIPYQAGSGEVQTRMRDVTEVARGLQPVDRIQRLSEAISMKMTELSSTIDLRRQHGLHAAEVMIMRDVGKNLMDEVRAKLDRIEIDSLTMARDAHDRGNLFARLSFLCLMMTLGSCIMVVVGPR